MHVLDGPNPRYLLQEPRRPRLRARAPPLQERRPEGSKPPVPHALKWFYLPCGNAPVLPIFTAPQSLTKCGIDKAFCGSGVSEGGIKEIGLVAKKTIYNPFLPLGGKLTCSIETKLGFHTSPFCG